jgi:hypothetical protein
MKRHLIKSLNWLGICGTLAVSGSAARVATAQVYIGPRFVQPWVYHPRVYVAPPVIVPAPVLVSSRVVIAPPVIIPPQMVVLPAPVVVPAPPVVVETSAPAPVTAEVADLQPLVAPIALYPDPLLSIVLPAATYPSQVCQAAQWLAGNPSPSEALIDAQAWEPSVKALVHYPRVLNQMNGDPKWTESLGSAFSSEPANVSRAIQDLRAKAMAVGSLVATPQIAIVQEAGVIAIQPAVETALYVPVYNPMVVYAEPAVLTFEAPYLTGPWLVNGYDWSGGTVFVGDWHGGYVVENHVWVRDRYFRVDHYHYWRHDVRYGPSPRVARHEFAHSREIRGRESVFHNGINRPLPIRTAHQPSPTRPDTGRPQHPNGPKGGPTGQDVTKEPRPTHAPKEPQSPGGAGKSTHGGGGGGAKKK